MSYRYLCPLDGKIIIIIIKSFSRFTNVFKSKEETEENYDHYYDEIVPNKAQNEFETQRALRHAKIQRLQAMGLGMGAAWCLSMQESTDLQYDVDTFMKDFAAKEQKRTRTVRKAIPVAAVRVVLLSLEAAKNASRTLHRWDWERSGYQAVTFAAAKAGRRAIDRRRDQSAQRLRVTML